MNEIYIYVMTKDPIGLHPEILAQYKAFLQYITGVKTSFRFCVKTGSF